MAIDRGPYSQACENNKNPILNILRTQYIEAGKVLEIGGGTGQHAVHFATQLNHLCWQSSDTAENIDVLAIRIGQARLSNLPGPISLDVNDELWNVSAVNYIFTANTLHIMSIESVENFFCHAGKIIQPGGRVCVYGPCKYNQAYTSESNARFDHWLKQRDPRSGIRDFEDLNLYAERAKLVLIEDHKMPANNQLLIWEKPLHT